MSRRDTYAAVDLGSNSFHMVVARLEHGQLRSIDNIKEMVRLAAGLDGHGRLSHPVRDRALECLARFGQRIRGIPDENIRAVGTQSIRRLHNPQSFLVVAETTLGAPIDIISGREEARLVYLGVCQGIASPGKTRLIIDIGGGSTECAVGSGIDPDLAESLPFGCVTVTRTHFVGGRITHRTWRNARDAVLGEFQAIAPAFEQSAWQRAIGSSGSNRAMLNICQQMGWCESEITREALARLRETLLAAGAVDQITLPGLSSERQPVIAGAAVVLDACFEAMGIDTMAVSPYALREGLLHDLLGRREHSDPRSRTIRAMAERYQVDQAQAERVRCLAVTAFDQIARDRKLGPEQRKMLEWVCRVHEAGLAIAHVNYQVHSAYLLEHSDLPGFTRQEQQFMATLARYHRKKIPPGCMDDLPGRLRPPCTTLLVLLRLAVTLARARTNDDLPAFDLQWTDDQSIRLELPAQWLQSHPLTGWGIRQDARQLARLGLTLETATLPECRQSAP